MLNFLSYLALESKDLPGLRGVGRIGLKDIAIEDANVGAASVFEQLISGIIGTLTVGAILWFIFQFIIGGFNWMTAGGDSKALEAARQKITNAVVGLIIVFAAVLFVGLIGYLLGIDNILNLNELILRLTPGVRF